MKRFYNMSIKSSFVYFMQKYELVLLEYLFLFLLSRRNGLQFSSLLPEEESWHNDYIKEYTSLPPCQLIKRIS